MKCIAPLFPMCTLTLHTSPFRQQELTVLVLFISGLQNANVTYNCSDIVLLTKVQ